jgi:hypothetical protein
MLLGGSAGIAHPLDGTQAKTLKLDKRECLSGKPVQAIYFDIILEA